MLLRLQLQLLLLNEMTSRAFVMPARGRHWLYAHSSCRPLQAAASLQVRPMKIVAIVWRDGCCVKFRGVAGESLGIVGIALQACHNNNKFGHCRRISLNVD